METIIYKGPPGSRLDHYLQSSFSLPAGRLHKYLRENKIKLNGRKAPLSSKLFPGDEIRLYFPGGGMPLQGLVILYEDDDLLAVQKPAGLLSGDNREDAGDSALSRARRHAGKSCADPGFPLLCHRLDRGTSGVLLLAKTPRMYSWVEQLLRERTLGKTYLCVTAGHPAPSTGVLEGYLSKDAARGKVSVHKTQKNGSKPVTTKYKTLATSGRLALLQVELVTGRTHQIRAHLAFAGAPVLGDGKYGNNDLNRELRCKRQCLCAVEAVFPQAVPAGFERYSGLAIRCEEPWYVRQVYEGVLV